MQNNFNSYATKIFLSERVNESFNPIYPGFKNYTCYYFETFRRSVIIYYTHYWGVSTHQYNCFYNYAQFFTPYQESQAKGLV